MARLVREWAAVPPGWTWLVGVALYAVLALPTCGRATELARPDSWLALLAVPAAVVLRARPVASGSALVVGGVWLRVVFASFGQASDQIVVGQAAAELVLAGGNPYGHGYEQTTPPGSPFPYGPLALLWSPLGVTGEIVAAAGTMALMAWARTFVVLGAYASFWVVVDLSMSGLNDVTPGFLIAAGLLALRHHPVLGGSLLALAGAYKPYALAWAPAAFGFGGPATIAAFLVTAAAVWSPLLVWGLPSFVRSIELAQATHPLPESTLNVPELRILAVPIAVASLFARRWWLVVASGTAIFFVVLFLDRWASIGYYLAVVPIAGIALEMAVRDRLALNATPA